MDTNNFTVQFRSLFEAVQCCDNVKYVNTNLFVHIPMYRRRLIIMCFRSEMVCPRCQPPVSLGTGSSGYYRFIYHLRTQHDSRDAPLLRHAERFSRVLVSIRLLCGG